MKPKVYYMVDHKALWIPKCLLRAIILPKCQRF